MSAQDYRSAFEVLKVDRTKTPVSFHGGVDVDPAIGVATMKIPLGPGVGRAGLRFSPTLVANWAPKATTGLVPHLTEGSEWGFASGSWTTAVRDPQMEELGGEQSVLIPGQLDLARFGRTGSVRFPDGQTLEFPIGSTRWGKVLNPNLDGGSLRALLDRYGYSTYEVVSDIDSATGAARYRVNVGPKGELLLVLRPLAGGSGMTDIPLVANGVGVGETMQPHVFAGVTGVQPYMDRVPRLLLVIREGVAYEFRDAQHRYAQKDYFIYMGVVHTLGDSSLWSMTLEGWPGKIVFTPNGPDLSDRAKASVEQAFGYTGSRYRLVAMRGLAGERIEFAFTFGGEVRHLTGYTATWIRESVADELTVKVSETAPNTYSIRYLESGAPTDQHFTYVVDPAPAGRVGRSLLELLFLGDDWGIDPRAQPDFFLGTDGVPPMPSSLTFPTGEQIRWTYTNGSLPTFPGDLFVPFREPASNPQPPYLLSAVDLPGRRLTFRWDSTRFRISAARSLWMGYLGRLPGWSWGVTRVEDTDTAAGQTRSTTYQRTAPQPARETEVFRAVGGPFKLTWDSTTFRTVVTHPDGSVTEFRYAEPSNDGTTGGPQPFSGLSASSQEGQLRTLAHLKRVPLQTLRYKPGAFGSGGPFHETRVDRLDVRTVANPSGLIDQNSELYPTRTVVLDREAGIQTLEELSDWDSAYEGWKHRLKRAEMMVEGAFSADYSSLAYKALAVGSYPPPSRGVQREDTRDLISAPALAMFALTGQQTHLPSTDTTGYQASAQGPAPTAITYDFQTNPADALNSGRPVLKEFGGPAGSSLVQLRLGYKTGSAFQAAELGSASLEGPGLTHSGAVGVASYGYDVRGQLATLQPMLPTGKKWILQETRNALGRVTGQTDPNQLANTIAYDSVGRMSQLKPPTTEVATALIYDPDYRGLTLTKGTQVTHLRYNGFGELVMEERQHPIEGWTHRLFGYDAGGRMIWETGWRGNRGSDLVWAQPLAPDDGVVAAQDAWDEETTRCIEWGHDPETGGSYCARYQVIHHPSIPPQLKYANSRHYTYDALGRITLVINPNGEAVRTTYPGLTKSVTTGLRWDPVAQAVVDPPTPTTKATTTFESDALGRLVKVTDALGQVTQYFFDAADRISRVEQMDGQGRVQARTWEYNALGWVTALNQPESGRTEYSNFTVLGKPQTTVYGAGSATPKTVTTTYDALGRVTSVVSADGTVYQTMAYDEPGRGLSNGKLTTATTGQGVSRQLTYGGLNGRLSGLTRSLEGQTFTQSLEWNNDGALSRRTYPGGRMQTLNYDAAKGLPSATAFGGAHLASFAYNGVHWGLEGLTWANGASSFFAYDADQVRLKAVTHMQGATTLKAWNYLYDPAGRLTTDGEDHYRYDPLGRLESALVRDFDPDTKTTSGSNRALQQIVNYDAFGNRKFLSSLAVTNWASGQPVPGSPATTALWGDLRDLRNYGMTDAERAVMAATNRLPETLNGVATGSDYDPQGNLTRIYRNPGDNATQLGLQYDALGRVSQMTDSARGITEVYRYDDEGLRAVVEVYQGAVAPANLQKKKIHIYNEARQMIAEYEQVLQ